VFARQQPSRKMVDSEKSSIDEPIPFDFEKIFTSLSPRMLISEAPASNLLMGRFTMQSVFPAPRERLWRVLKLHVEDDQIGRIHPNFLFQRQVSREGNRWVLERKIRLLGRNYTTTWTVEMTPPETYRWEIVASDGLLVPGSYVENKYTDAEDGGTKVSTTVQMTLKGVPGFLQNWMIKRNLSRGDDEDLEYLRKMQT